MTALGLHWAAQVFSSRDTRVSHCRVFSCCRAQALTCMGFSSRSTQAQGFWLMGVVALWHVASSQTTDQTCVPCKGSVQFSRTVLSDSLRPHESQHTRPPCPSPTLGVYSNPCPLSQWCHFNHLSLCHPLLLLPPISPSIRLFSNESALRMRWPKYWSFSFNISPSNKHPGLISFRMDWLDLLAVQGTLKNLLQHHSSKASIFRCSAFLTVQLSHPYMTTGKTTALTRQTFVGKVMSLLFNMLSRLVITFLPRSKCLLISWLQSPSAVILESRKIVWHCFHCKGRDILNHWTTREVQWLTFKY